VSNDDQRSPKWREDFPYESDNDDYIARRDFTRFMVVVSGGLAAGTGLVLLRSRTHENAVPMRREVARVADIEPGTARVFHFPDEQSPAILVRRADGEFVAFDQRCTHLACPVTYSTRDEETEREALHCHCHNGRFDVTTGVGISGPPRELRPLRRIALDIVDGAVFATGFERV
jgi:nitrite reductase/ring-hydroxylating ferredoxin subunit